MSTKRVGGRVITEGEFSVGPAFPTAEMKSSAIRKTRGRPKSRDPKVSVTLSIRRSTLERITSQLLEGQSVPWALSAAVERKYGEPARTTEVAPRLKHVRS